MTNKEISDNFKILAALMELYDENPFKVKSYANAYLVIRKSDKVLAEHKSTDIQNIIGIGKNIGEKINELISTGKMDVLEEYLTKTPPGIVQMLKVRGLGPKKIKTIWKELGIEDLSELLLACNENRLVAAKGFGQKSQEDIKQKIEFFLSSSGKYHYALVIDIAEKLVQLLNSHFPEKTTMITGSLRRKMPVVDGIELLSTLTRDDILPFMDKEEERNDDSIYFQKLPVHFVFSNTEEFEVTLFNQSASDEFLEAFGPLENHSYVNEMEIFTSKRMDYVVPEYRESQQTVAKAKSGTLPKLIEKDDIKGLIHAHSTYSDGVNTLKEMKEACIFKGYQYLVITDHSASAFYANGLKVDRLQMQWDEIDQLNMQSENFQIFKGIESDILYDGSLDYEDDVLKQFDFIIVSIHSNLQMDKDKATARLIKAIEHESTVMLGHPTGRLLLGRKGYEINHQKVIDACAANCVTIEINSNPQRMDLDWTWIPYALEKGIKLSVNPDAHNISQMDFVSCGVETARKGGLTAQDCVNCMDLITFKYWIKNR